MPFNPALSCMFFLALERGAVTHAGTCWCQLTWRGVFWRITVSIWRLDRAMRDLRWSGPGQIIVRYRVDYAHS